jgi:DNA-binding LacI/PurR family transcriptional regulator
MKKNAKYEFIVNSIREKIRSGKFEPGRKLPGQFALAEEYGVSAITSNRALSELQKLGLVERRERSGTYVSGNPRVLTDIFIAVRCSLDGNMTMQEYWEGINSKASELGISAHVMKEDDLFRKKIRKNKNGTGVILLMTENDETLDTLEKSGVPFVLASMEGKRSKYCVSENRRRASAELCRKMIAEGCKRIAFLGSISSSPNHRSAFYGYLEGVAKLDIGEKYVRNAQEKNISCEIKDLIKQNPPPDAFVISGGNLPVVALPELLSISPRPKLGFLTENSTVKHLNNVAFIASYSRFEVGRMAVELLNNAALGKVSCSTVIYPPFEILPPLNS